MYVQLAPEPDNVSLARQRVTSFARDVGVPPSRVDDVALAVSEAVTNALAAHRQADSGKSVALMADIEDSQTLEVTVADQGPGFVAPAHGEPLPAAPDSPDDVAEGLGLTVMRQLADEVEFVRAQGMTVSLRFRLST